jgi:hypothetical protein
LFYILLGLGLLLVVLLLIVHNDVFGKGDANVGPGTAVECLQPDIGVSAIKYNVC